MFDFETWSDLEKAMTFSTVIYFTLAWYIHRLQGRVDALNQEMIKLRLRE